MVTGPDTLAIDTKRQRNRYRRILRGLGREDHRRTRYDRRWRRARHHRRTDAGRDRCRGGSGRAAVGLTVAVGGAETGSGSEGRGVAVGPDTCWGWKPTAVAVVLCPALIVTVWALLAVVSTAPVGPVIRMLALPIGRPSMR